MDGPANLRHFDRQLEGITGRDVIVLPEVFSSGFAMEAAKQSLPEADEMCIRDRQYGRQDIQSHHPLVVADRHHRPLAAVGIGGKMKALALEEMAPVSYTHLLAVFRRRVIA